MYNELTLKKIQTEVQQHMNAQYLFDEELLMASIDPMYVQVNNIQ